MIKLYEEYTSNEFIDFSLPKIEGVYLLFQGDVEYKEKREDMLEDREEDLILSIFKGFKVIIGYKNVYIEYYYSDITKEKISISVKKIEDDWFIINHYECILNKQKPVGVDPTWNRWIENVYMIKCDQNYGLENALLFLKERCEYVNSYREK